MTPSMIIDAILSLGVLVMVVSPLVWAIRTARRDVPAGTAKARLQAGATLVRRSRRPATPPQFGAPPRQRQAWPTA
jgi:hypothetical protein